MAGEAAVDAAGSGGVKRTVIKRVAIIVLAVVAALVIRSALRGVDWSGVAEALSRFAPWQIGALLLMLAVRQLANSLPLALLVPGLGVGRALLNDSTANLIAYMAPPPADLLMRMSMFRTWSIDLKRGMTGVTLNTVIFYIMRFAAPVVGLVILALSGHFSPSHLTALVSVLVSASLLVGLALVMKGDGPAIKLGRAAASVARRFRRSVDPDHWAATLVELRRDSLAIVCRAFAPSLLILIGMIAADSLIVLLTIRFVGVGPALLPVGLVVGCFFLAYPLTLFPVQGLGLLDATLIALLVAGGGEAFEADVVAALIVWRVITILVPLILGLPSLIAARRSARRQQADADPSGSA